MLDCLGEWFCNRIWLETKSTSLSTSYYVLPVTCLVEPESSRLLQPVDPAFIANVKTHINSNPVRDVTPIVGLVQLSNGEEFERDQRKSYLYKS